MNTRIKYILFDAANTLIHKPQLWSKFLAVFKKYNCIVNEIELKQKHKILSEVIRFPDVTSKDFYFEFNSELCRLLGIVPNLVLLQDIFESCKYLPWEAFEDTSSLKHIKLPIGVLSNFNKELPKLLSKKIKDVTFDTIVVSETEGVAKPNINFYKKAIEKIGMHPNEILYIGDSIKLDIEPAQNLGFQVKLIDRDNFFKGSNLQLKSLNLLIDNG